MSRRDVASARRTGPWITRTRHAAPHRRLRVRRRPAEELGIDAVRVEETKDDPYQLLALGAAATSTIGLGTSSPWRLIEVPPSPPCRAGRCMCGA